MESHLNVVLHCMMCLVTGESTHVDAIKMFYTQSAQSRGEEKDRLLAGIQLLGSLFRVHSTQTTQTRPQHPPSTHVTRRRSCFDYD